MQYCHFWQLLKMHLRGYKTENRQRTRYAAQHLSNDVENYRMDDSVSGKQQGHKGLFNHSFIQT